MFTFAGRKLGDRLQQAVGVAVGDLFICAAGQPIECGHGVARFRITLRQALRSESVWYDQYDHSYGFTSLSTSSSAASNVIAPCSSRLEVVCLWKGNVAKPAWCGAESQRTMS